MRILEWNFFIFCSVYFVNFELFVFVNIFWICRFDLMKCM